MRRTRPQLPHLSLHGSVGPAAGHPPGAARRVGLLLAAAALLLPGPAQAGSKPKGPRTLVVDSLADGAVAPAGRMTLRAALEQIRPGGKITFDRALDGGTIRLSEVASEHTVLLGETFPAGKFAGYAERDYGRSALSVRKSVTIDASALPSGITLAWTGGVENPARVLAVYGNLTMTNVTVTGGVAQAAATADPLQPWTLARGGGLAIWGTATLRRCTFWGNRVAGDLDASRDRGAFGGAIYGNLVHLSDSVVAGNAVSGYGGAGGGVYSVGGAGVVGESWISRTTVSGNRVTAQHAYGGGIYTDGGGPGNRKTLTVENCTIARNLVEDNPALPEPSGSQYYYRGGGIYMSNGSLVVAGSTVVENVVTGIPATFRGRPNMGGGALAATIGDAHTVEQIRLRHSILAGNTLNGAASDVFTGSLIQFTSDGYNLVGDLDASQILVPIPPWWSLSRKHWPKAGDRDGVPLSSAVELDGAAVHAAIVSAGVDPGSPAVLWYPPGRQARDQVPGKRYRVTSVQAQYRVLPGHSDRMLEAVLERLRTEHGALLGSDFGEEFGDVRGIPFVPTPAVWPNDPANARWIRFWRDLDAALDGRLGAAGLEDEFWGSFDPGPGSASVVFQRRVAQRDVKRADEDQRGDRRSKTESDIGAIED
jgi:hypothetical protein